MAHTLTQTAEEFEKVFPEAAILLRMTLQSAIDSYRVDTGSSEIEELRAQNAELRSKLSRPKSVGRPRNTPAIDTLEMNTTVHAKPRRTVL